MHQFYVILLGIIIACNMFYVPQVTSINSIERAPKDVHLLQNAHIQVRNECIDTFSSFAYRALIRSQIESVISLSNPWEYISTLSDQNSIRSVTFPRPDALTNALTGRNRNGEQEIWVISTILNQGERSTEISIYDVTQGMWETFPGIVEGIGQVENVFFTNDGSAWGLLSQSVLAVSDSQRIPVLSRFNEDTRRFEVAPGVVETTTIDDSIARNHVRILLDQQGVFWIFNVDESIYTYDSASLTSERQRELAGVGVSDTALASDGSIYFSDISGSTLPDLSQSRVYQYIPETNEVVSVTLPNEPWPNYSGLLVDSNNQLWLGAVGYRDTDGGWNLIHTAIDEYFENAPTTFWWFTPRIMYETSDGRLWFYRYADTGAWLDGTAWYNPMTDEGCQISTTPGLIFEDADQQIWFLMGDDLYRSSLNSQD